MVVSRNRVVEPASSTADGPSPVARIAVVASVLALLALLTAGLQATGSAPAGASTGSWPVAASCIGPSLTHAGGPAGRGQTITITGAGFGTECYDTGPPPAGEGGLGPPRQGIELVLVQGDQQVVVATGDADDAYGFRVDVVVPAQFAPGDATLLARSTEDPAFGATSERPVVITDAVPTASPAPAAVATFGPAEAAPTTTSAPSTTTTAAPTGSASPVPRTTEEEGGFPTTVVGGLVIAALVLGGAILIARQHDAPA